MLKRVTVHLYSQSKPLEYLDVDNAYTKGMLYCVRQNESVVHKFPLQHIFRITEEQ